MSRQTELGNKDRDNNDNDKEMYKDRRQDKLNKKGRREIDLEPML